MGKLSRKIVLRLTDQEHREIQRRAAAEGLSINEYLRRFHGFPPSPTANPLCSRNPYLVQELKRSVYEKAKAAAKERAANRVASASGPIQE